MYFVLYCFYVTLFRAGAGRTGTYIAIDATLDRAMADKTVDIFNYVLYLRNSRQNMVKHQVKTMMDNKS